MRAYLVLAVTLAGCSSKHDGTRRERRPADARPIDAEDLSLLTPSQRAAIDSPPRDQWACGFDVTEEQGFAERGHVLYHFGKRTHCRLPLSLVAQGIWGCPESYTRTDESDGMVREHELTYDDQDRLASYTVQVREDFTWDGTRLASTGRTQWGQTDSATYRDRGAELVAIDKDKHIQESMTFDGDRVTHYDEYVYGYKQGAGTITWRDGKPQVVDIDVLGPIRGHVTRTFLYDCPTKR